ncbi:uncharacterized protein AB675_68 [Cyphellophora attinorum]|uniref:histidine kinase n=1 Tax=Cyphellophora attinorum TaxID=1664694 RepID=A0A0N1NX66_9EURO|nr:uncharacterized protein AB675_68 [Phialophora attinorum]KPI34667.1 hypothetical protein AB675_68 [Phialophora attinorum]
MKAACVNPGSYGSSRSSRKESRREQHFYRYYGPLRQMSDRGPKFCDVRDPVARARHQAVSSPDKILTAFCQLGALRLKARRCLVFFFDVTRAYVMAEATQTLSLESDSTHGPGDELWLGYSTIPRDIACCEITIGLPHSLAVDATEYDRSKSAFVVNDLTAHPDLSSRAYVTEYPHGRFYAGVPITTPSGVNIGAYCILDDKPRDGVSREDLTFLRDMSQTIMTHLETVRSHAEKQQSNRMVAGIRSFIRGTSDVGPDAWGATEWQSDAGQVNPSMHHAVEYRLPATLIDPLATPTLSSTSATRNEYFSSEASSQQLPKQHSVQSGDNTAEAVSADDWVNTAMRHRMRTSTWDTLPTSDPRKHSHMSRFTPQSRGEADPIKRTFQRGAEVLCHCLSVDGVALLDASVRMFGGLGQHSEESTEGSSHDSDESDGMHTQADQPVGGWQAQQTRPCRVLGCAQALPDHVMATQGSDAQSAVKLTESYLRGLLRRHPTGEIWTFDQDLKLVTEDVSSSSDEASGVNLSSGAPSPATRKRRKALRSDAEILQSQFPGARCIALRGIWDHTRKRWSVGGIYWSYDPLRILTTDVEMPFVAAFNDVIIAEIRRLEVLGADKAKSDFISSVSHELRSPLHGILGSAELLSGYAFDSTASSLVEQINSCGHTLLDVIDHLLDFAHLKSLGLRKGAVKSSRIGRGTRSSGSSGRSPPAEGALEKLDESIALDDVTEGVVASTVYSFYYNQDAADRTYTPVILDVDSPGEPSWRCSLATGGWKRICMNLVTNALKYTPSGFIRVTLKQKPRPGSHRRSDAVLTVADSGIGMSTEFQKNHLFRDFSQEDTLSSGLGLGMHMVSRMVSAMGGRIEVTSNRDGTGTRIVVQIPLDHSRPHQDRNNSHEKKRFSLPSQMFGNLKVGFLKASSPPPTDRESALIATASAMARASVKKSLQSMGAHVETCQRVDQSNDLNIVVEADLADVLAELQQILVVGSQALAPPTLVVCIHSPSAAGLQEEWSTHPLQPRAAMAHIAMPCGTRQIGQAILDLLQLQNQRAQQVSNKSTHVEDLRGNVPTEERIVMDQNVAHDQTEKPWHGIVSHRTTSSIYETVVAVTPSPVEDETPGWLSLPSTAGTSGANSVGTLSPELLTPMTEQTSLFELCKIKGPTLLLVDDNDINLRLLVAFAKKLKYSYTTAVDGELAVDAFKHAHRNRSQHRSHWLRDNEAVGNKNDSQTNSDTTTVRDENNAGGAPGVIFMDINMPVMDGYEAVQQIRAYEKRHHMAPATIIAVTALQSEAAQAEAFGSGFDIFLSKPLKWKDLAKLMAELVVK